MNIILKILALRKHLMILIIKIYKKFSYNFILFYRK